MKIGMVGLGRMGGNMIRRILQANHQCVVYDSKPEAIDILEKEGAIASFSREGLVESLTPPRVIWIMIPANKVDAEIESFQKLLKPGDILIDGGNSHFQNDRQRALQLKKSGIQYIDVGTSGGIRGRTRGYCLMVGGEQPTFRYLEPIFQALAPSIDPTSTETTRENSNRTAERGYCYCGPAGAGHFVKMVHNAIEYGIMASYAEGLNILHRANPSFRNDGLETNSSTDAINYDFNIEEITELWRHGSIISSWLLDLTVELLGKNGTLENTPAQVPDSGTGRWAIETAIEESAPTGVLSAALFARFNSRNHASFSNRLISALRHLFGGY